MFKVTLKYPRVQMQFQSLRLLLIDLLCMGFYFMGSPTHRMYRTKPYIAWFNMKQRCYNANNNRYKSYGARGIKVCDSWHKFENFIADMGLPPSDAHTLDRKDNDKDYYPDNCRWASEKVQANNKTTNVRLTYNRLTLTVSQWARLLGLDDRILHFRLNSGFPIEQVLTSKRYTNDGTRRIKTANK